MYPLLHYLYGAGMSLSQMKGDEFMGKGASSVMSPWNA